MIGFRKGMLALALTAASVGGGVAATEAFASPAFAADATTTTTAATTDTTAAPSTSSTAPTTGDGSMANGC